MNDFPVRTSTQLPQLLQAFRKQSGLTQSGAALRMGLTQQALSEIERHPERVSVDRLLRLLNVLGVELVLRKAPEDERASHDSQQIW